MKDIKKDNKKLSEENGKSVLQITALEEELLDETDEEVYEEAANDPQKNPEKVLKCEMCEYTTTNNITFKKHMNTKHTNVPDNKVMFSTKKMTVKTLVMMKMIWTYFHWK